MNNQVLYERSRILSHKVKVAQCPKSLFLAIIFDLFQKCLILTTEIKDGLRDAIINTF